MKKIIVKQYSISETINVRSDYSPVSGVNQ